MTKIHIATGDFCFIEVDFDGEPLEAISEAKRLQEAVLGQPGLSPQAFNKVLDAYLRGEPMTPDDYYAMNDKQQTVIQEVKKARKRLQTKGEELEIN